MSQKRCAAVTCAPQRSTRKQPCGNKKTEFDRNVVCTEKETTSFVSFITYVASTCRSSQWWYLHSTAGAHNFRCDCGTGKDGWMDGWAWRMERVRGEIYGNQRKSDGGDGGPPSRRLTGGRARADHSRPVLTTRLPPIRPPRTHSPKMECEECAQTTERGVRTASRAAAANISQGRCERT
jgi:hypothetical protein